MGFPFKRMQHQIQEVRDVSNQKHMFCISFLLPLEVATSTISNENQNPTPSKKPKLNDSEKQE